MDQVAAGDCTYVPTQLYPTQRTDSPQSLSLLALRRLRLMSATEHSNTTLGKIYIGNCVEAMQWAGEHVGYVIDASDGRSNVNAIVQKPFPRGWWPCPLCGSFLYFLSPSSLSHVLRNYAWHRDCVRQWLWISRGRRQSAAGTWWHRMENAIKMVLIAVLFGPSVLIHCRQGKHRSGAIGCFMFCLLTGCDFNMAMNAYRTRNRRLQARDMRLVRRCWGENNMDEALHYFRRQQWVRNMIGNIQHKICARPVPCPLPRDRSRSPRRSLQPTSKRMPKRMPLPLPKRRPTPKPQPKPHAKAPASEGRPRAADEVAGAESAAVPSPSSTDAARAADEVGRDRTPSPPAGHRMAWTCEACGNLNLRQSLHCSRTGCDGRQPQRLQAGDWECHQCGHSNRH